jgi:hypothetical protein
MFSEHKIRGLREKTFYLRQPVLRSSFFLLLGGNHFTHWERDSVAKTKFTADDVCGQRGSGYWHRGFTGLISIFQSELIAVFHGCYVMLCFPFGLQWNEVQYLIGVQNHNCFTFWTQGVLNSYSVFTRNYSMWHWVVNINFISAKIEMTSGEAISLYYPPNSSAKFITFDMDSLPFLTPKGIS